MKVTLFLCIGLLVCSFGEIVEIDSLGSGEFGTDIGKQDSIQKVRINSEKSVCDPVECFGEQECEEFYYHNVAYAMCYPKNLYELLASICATRNTCLNNGTCANGVCLCPPNVHGLLCETTFTMCAMDPSPCDENQMCITVSGGGYRCQTIDDSSLKPKPINASNPTAVAVATTTTEDVCTEHICLGDNCRCVPSCKHEFGFYCVSDVGNIGRNCNIGPPVLQCEASTITVRILYEFVEEFDNGFNSTVVFVSDSVDGVIPSPECTAARRGEWLVVTIPAPFTACGNVATLDDGEVVYKNTLWVNRVAATSFDFPQPIMNFNCTYETDYIITTNLRPVVDKVIPSLSAMVHGRLSISLCKVSVCRDECPFNLAVKKGAVYTVNENLHLGLAMQDSRSTGGSAFETNLVEAFLSCSQSRSSSTKVVLIDGCDTSAALSVEVGRRNSASTCMSFRVPKMVGCSTVYVHFKVSWCLSVNLRNESCASGRTYRRCVNGVEKRSVSEEVDDAVYHVFGPLHFVNSWKEISFVSDDGPVVVLKRDHPSTTVVSPVLIQTKENGEFRWTLALISGFALVMVTVVLAIVIWRMRRNVPPHSKIPL